MASTSNPQSWREGEFTTEEDLANVSLNDDNVDRVLDSLSGLPNDVIAQIVVRSRWRVQTITRFCQVNRQWNEKFCGPQSMAIWLGLLLRDFDLSNNASAMTNRTAGAAAQIAESMQRFVIGDSNERRVAQRARKLYRALFSFSFADEALPFAQDPSAELSDDAKQKLAAQLIPQPSRDPTAEQYFALIKSEKMHAYVYENAFMVVKPCFEGSSNALYLLTDAVQYVLNENSIVDAFAAGRLARGERSLDVRRERPLHLRYDTDESVHPPMVLDGGGVTWNAWPRVTVGEGPELLSIGNHATTVVAIPGGSTPYLYWKPDTVAQPYDAFRLFSTVGQPDAVLVPPLHQAGQAKPASVLALTERHAIVLMNSSTSPSTSFLLFMSLDMSRGSVMYHANSFSRPAPRFAGIYHETDRYVYWFFTRQATDNAEIVFRRTDLETMTAASSARFTWPHGYLLTYTIIGRYIVIDSTNRNEPAVVIRTGFDDPMTPSLTFLAAPERLSTPASTTYFDVRYEANEEEAAFIASVARSRNYQGKVKCERSVYPSEFDEDQERSKRQRTAQRLT